MTKIGFLKKNANLLIGKNSSIFFFAGFLIVNLYYFVTNFFLIFLNEESNGDEYYQSILYPFYNFSLQKFFYSPSQPYIFISSFVDVFFKSPKYSTRIVSFLFCLALIVYFLKKINTLQSSTLEKIYKIALFVCALFITNQMYIGTSDFLSFFLLVPAFLIILESIDSKSINLTSKMCVGVGLLLALAIATRPTAIILITMFYSSIFLILGFKLIFCKQNFIILFSGIFVLFLINFLPIVQQNKVVLDVKEIPIESGVNWFERNYLMAKFWDSNKIPRTQWVSTQDVIDFKKENPNFKFPKNQIDLLLKEPKLYIRQMIRMVTTGVYTSFRFMYLLFPFLFLSLLKVKKNIMVTTINDNYKKDVARNKIIIIFHFLSIIVFSFVALKMFEFRWVIPIMILYVYYAIIYLSKFPEKIRFMVYTFSFMCSILLYSIFFIKNL